MAAAYGTLTGGPSANVASTAQWSDGQGVSATSACSDPLHHAGAHSAARHRWVCDYLHLLGSRRPGGNRPCCSSKRGLMAYVLFAGRFLAARRADGSRPERGAPRSNAPHAAAGSASRRFTARLLVLASTIGLGLGTTVYAHLKPAPEP